MTSFLGLRTPAAQAGQTITNVAVWQPDLILARLDPPPGYFDKIHIPNLLDQNGNPQLDLNGDPIRDFPFLPRFLPAEISGADMAAYFRKSFWLTHKDLWARQPTGTPFPNALRKNALNMNRKRQGELPYNARSWSKKYVNRPTRTLVTQAEKLTDQQISFNISWTITPQGVHPPGDPTFLTPLAAFSGFLHNHQPHVPSKDIRDARREAQRLTLLATQRGKTHWSELEQADLPKEWFARLKPSSESKQLSGSEMSPMNSLDRPLDDVKKCAFNIGKAQSLLAEIEKLDVEFDIRSEEEWQEKKRSKETGVQNNKRRREDEDEDYSPPELDSKPQIEGGKELMDRMTGTRKRRRAIDANGSKDTKSHKTTKPVKDKAVASVSRRRNTHRIQDGGPSNRSSHQPSTIVSPDSMAKVIQTQSNKRRRETDNDVISTPYNPQKRAKVEPDVTFDLYENNEFGDLLQDISGGQPGNHGDEENEATLPWLDPVQELGRPDEQYPFLPDPSQPLPEIPQGPFRPYADPPDSFIGPGFEIEDIDGALEMLREYVPEVYW